MTAVNMHAIIFSDDVKTPYDKMLDPNSYNETSYQIPCMILKMHQMKFF